MNKELDQNISVQEYHSLFVNGSTSYFHLQSNITYLPFYQHTSSVATVFIISYLLIFLLCMLGNGLVCFIVVRNRHMRTVTNLFILNLAISDLLVGIFCMPTTLVDNILTGWPFGSFVCKISGLVQGISVSASVFTLVAIAVDRFRCIVYPFKQKLNVIVATIIIVIIWVLAVSIICPSAIMLRVIKLPDSIKIIQSSGKIYPCYQCYEAWPDPKMRKIYTTVLFSNIYLAPLALMVIMYARIGIALFKTSIPIGKGSHQENSSTVSKKKQRVIKMLATVALLFALSWLPLWTLMMLSDYTRLSHNQLRIINLYIYPFAHWLAFCNSSVNPIIYGYFNKNFRRGFQAAFKFQLCSAEVKHQETYSHRNSNKFILTAQNKVGQDPATSNSDAVEDCSTSRADKNAFRQSENLALQVLDKGINNCS
ncbi:neuropeptide FF receptor 2a [Chiloscyllium plagiosum]|uniref:neuropeptide FF receptor 2a n=1 Tax=Chiloscyllium plagiosum TaxID=36176 RepID=UPI001CB7CEF1|nr:neuropeptide FF receptor 2a [Chiloscyllium plagiosum]XP_043576412.1 neuropeptide FF receptor 2a [Chiloscyllium plagiosum]